MNDESKIRYVSVANAAGLQQLVAKAVGGYGKARIAIQVAIVAVLCHAAKHNDYSQASALVNGLGGKTARDVATFFKDFGGFSQEAVPEGEDKPDGFNAWQGPEYIAERLDAAKAQMFWTYKQPKSDAFKSYSLEDMARQFIKRHEDARKAADAGKAELDDSLSEVTMQAVLKLVKFEKLAQASDKGERKAA